MSTNKKNIILIYFELYKLVCQKIKGTNKKFILISSGSSSEKIFAYSSNIKELESYFIFCFNTDKYIYLMNKYPKLKGIFNIFEDLKNKLYSINTKERKNIKSSNLITFNEYNNIYIKLHFELIRKYSLYKILKLKNIEEKEFLNYIKTEIPYFLEIAQQLFPDKNEIIQFFMKNTNEDKELIFSTFNCDDNIKSYIHNYTSESFYYRYINKFLREGDFDAFRILSSHLSKFIYNLYDYREKNFISIGKTNLYRKMYINEIELEKYRLLKGEVICYPSFTSTSIIINGYEPKKYNDNDVLVQLIIEQNNTKFAVPIHEFSEFPEEEEYLFLPFSFFKILKIEYGSGNSINPHKIYLLALNSDKTIEEMFLDFMKNETDNLMPDGLDLLILKIRKTKIIFNPIYFRENNNKYKNL